MMVMCCGRKMHYVDQIGLLALIRISLSLCEFGQHTCWGYYQILNIALSPLFFSTNS